jgi:membrane carboxypeptidase/penicillin-binding protein PbpC
MNAIPVGMLPKINRLEINTDKEGKTTMRLIKDSKYPGWFINGRKLTDDEYRESYMKINMTDNEIAAFDMVKEALKKEDPNVSFARAYREFVKRLG